MKKIKVVCIVGPTASGKTDLGVAVSKAANGEVVSADSMQIYKDMHIASAAADIAEMQGVPHYMLEFLPYGSSYSVCDYVKAAKEVIFDINSRGKLPVIVGGTGLYVDSLIKNIQFTEHKFDPEIRKKLSEKADTVGTAAMLEELRKIDPQAAEKLHENDRRRIIRAFEIIEQTGITPTKQNELSLSEESPFDALMIGVSFADRQKLYDRINARVDIMLQNGLLDEAKAAFQKNMENSGGIQAIGHKEFFPFFKGEISLEEATEKLKQSTRRYAKRQLTWFNANPDINWIFRDETENAAQKAIELLKMGGIL